MVKKGEFLLQIDPPSYEALSQQQRGAGRQRSRRRRRRRKRTSTQSQRDLPPLAGNPRKRNPNLVSDDQMEQFKTAVDVNQALYDAAQAQRGDQAAGRRQERDSRVSTKTTIVAPMTGQVTRLIVQNGETAIQGDVEQGRGARC